MGAESTGRKLGIGLRLAARAVQQRAVATAVPSSSAPKMPPAAAPAPYYRYQGTVAQAVTDAVRGGARAPTIAQGVTHGAKRFAGAIWGPVAHTGSVLTLEITGLFFGLFTLYLGQNAYKVRSNYRHGPEHVHFLVYSLFTLIFAWFTCSNFYRARKREKKNRARRAAR